MGGITLDIEKPDGRAILLELCNKADVVIETFRPSRARELRLTYPDLSAGNPKLIVASITPFGQNGPWKDYKANDMAGPPRWENAEPPARHLRVRHGSPSA